jgi:inner membrane transporter RhtA
MKITTRLNGVALMTGSAASNQVGAATAALAFPVLGPAGVVAVRQWVAGIVLLSIVRPRFISFTRRQWLPVLAMALIFGTMNLALYTAIDRVGLGLAVTLEFLGPLSVALLSSRRLLDLACGVVAGVAVVALARPQPSTDYAGIALALLAAACWAGYILLNRVIGARLPGSAGPATAAGLSATLYVPIGVWALTTHPVTLAATGRAATAGVLCSAVPMVADMRALRRVPARFYGVFMSVNPVFAALTGLVVLGQSLKPVDWLAIAAIAAANGVAAAAASVSELSGRLAAEGLEPRRAWKGPSRPGEAVTARSVAGGGSGGRSPLENTAGIMASGRLRRTWPHPPARRTVWAPRATSSTTPRPVQAAQARQRTR